MILDIRNKLHRQIDQLLPEQLSLLSDFLDFLQFKGSQAASSPMTKAERQPSLHPGSFTIAKDFDEPLPDSFWLGEE